MPSVAKTSRPGRNDPCWCGSGKKYKTCHLPIEEAERAEQRKLRQAHDTLLPKIIEAAQGVPEVFPQAMSLFWKDAYTPEQMSELDDLEDRGAERFLTWLAFDYPLEDGRTLVEMLAQAAETGEQTTGDFVLDSYEQRLIQSWQPVRLRPYLVTEVFKGKGMTVRDMLDDEVFEVEDHAASRRLAPDEVLVGHMVPAAGTHFVTGAAAQLTPDTADKLLEIAQLHLEDMRRDNTTATWSDLLRQRSYIFNQFVQALPREEHDPTMLENIVLQTRTALKLTGESLTGLVGIGKGNSTPDETAQKTPEDDKE